MERLSRPKVVGSLNVKVATGCGNLYIQMGWWQGSIHEVFATLGRGGGCSMSFSEGLTRSITAGLRRGVPVDEYIDQLQGIRCPTPRPFPKKDAVWSCPDAIAKALKEYGSLTTEGMIKLIQGLDAQPSTGTTSGDSELEDAIKRMEELRIEREKIEP